MGNVPHTAGPTGAFSIPRFASTAHNSTLFPPEEEDELADMISHNMYIQDNAARMHQPMTAAVDGGANRFAQQQSMAAGGGVPMNPYMSQAAQANMQAIMQLEIAARLQALQMQQQQYQAELMAQAQRQQRVNQLPQRRSTVGLVPPATAGPMTTGFDISVPQMRRPSQAEQLRAMLGVGNDDQVPMTAALGGRFGSRIGHQENENNEFPGFGRNTHLNYTTTSVISGGTSLGNGSHNGQTLAPSKSDTAVSWRRTSPVLNGNRMASSPVVKITPPPTETTSGSGSPPAASPLKTRPPALRFTPASSQPINVVAVDAEGTDGEESSSVSSKSGSAPSTPRTASSAGEMPPLSPREEASKKLYEGLGIGRPAPAVVVSVAPPSVQRLVSQPMRQPRGPPSNNDELLPKNFATRSRRKAIGALGALMDAREKREFVEAF